MQDNAAGQSREMQSAGTFSRERWLLLLLAAALLVSVTVRLRLLDIPLERDEGEYAYAGQLILQGIPPYEQCYNMKMPGIYAAYAAIMGVFGQTLTGIHLGFLIMNLGTAAFVFLIGSRWLGKGAGILAAALYALLSVSQTVQGVFVHSEHFVVFFFLAGLLALTPPGESASGRPRAGALRLFLAGILLGLAFLMKQHGLFLVGFAFLYVLVTEWSSDPGSWRRLAQRLAILAAGTLTPFLVVCLILWLAGVFETFWFWTFSYAQEYVSLPAAGAAWDRLSDRIDSLLDHTLWIWIAGGLGLFSLARRDLPPRTVPVVLLLALLAFLATTPGFYFRPHYFVLLLPPLSLLGGLGLDSIHPFLRTRVPPLLAGTAAALLVLLPMLSMASSERDYLFRLQPEEVVRAIYRRNPFVESIEIAGYVRENTAPDDRIAVIGSEPQIFFYSNRKSATGYIYTYPLMEDQPFAARMQKEMIREIESSEPAIFIQVNVPTSVGMEKGSDPALFQWANSYRKQRYDLVGLVNILRDRTEFFWEEDARRHRPEGVNWVAVFKRR
jgi:hypothetical protein